jgi:hypothetical protein
MYMSPSGSLSNRPGHPQFLADLVGTGGFGPLCGNADGVRLAGPGHGRGERGRST